MIKWTVSLAASTFLLTGCASYKIPTYEYAKIKDGVKEQKREEFLDLQERATSHPLYDFVPRHRDQLKWADPRWATWLLLGNDDNGIFGEYSVKPYSEKITYSTAGKWAVRNPLHNFTFYGIGSTGWKEHKHFSLIKWDDEGFDSFTTDEQKAFGKGRASLQLTVNDYKPYISFAFPIWKNRDFRFDAGWRPNGSASFKITPAAKAKKKDNN